MSETKNIYFESELEMQKLNKELKDVKMKYIQVHKKNLKIKDQNFIQKENFINSQPVS